MFTSSVTLFHNIIFFLWNNLIYFGLTRQVWNNAENVINFFGITEDIELLNLELQKFYNIHSNLLFF